MMIMGRLGICGGVFTALLLSACASSPEKQAVEPVVSNKTSALSDSARQSFDQAYQLLQQEKYAEGIALLERVVTESQNNAVPYINLAIAYTRLEKYEAAESSLKKALVIEPENPVALNEYAMVFRKTGRFQESRQAYEALLKKYPNYPVAHKNLAILCDLYLRDYDCALRGYQAYSTAVPADKTVQIWVSDVQKRMGK